MFPGECVCNEQYEEDNCNSNKPVSRCRSFSDLNDFIEEIGQIKCKVVNLTREQIKKSRNNQNDLLCELNEESRDISFCDETQDESPNPSASFLSIQTRMASNPALEKENIDKENTQDKGTATHPGKHRDGLLSMGQTTQNLYNDLSNYRPSPTFLLFLVLMMLLLAILFAIFVVLSTVLCSKGGFCLPLSIYRVSRPRVY